MTFFYDKWFMVRGNELTRYIYLGDKLIAESTVSAPAGLTLAGLKGDESIRLAREFGDALDRSLYPEVRLSPTTAASVAVVILLGCVVIVITPGRTRLGYFGNVRRGYPGLLLVMFTITLTPLPLARPAAAGGGGGGGPPPIPPKYPTLFFHTDHLGSTLMLTCANQPSGQSCADGAVYRFLRYDAYGQIRAYSGSGAGLSRGNEGTERLYTGQRWDWAAQVYYYHARFYDPRVANFLTIDPAREYTSPYAYVRWNPMVRVDPTGAISDAALALVLQVFLTYGHSKNDPDALAAGQSFGAMLGSAQGTGGGTYGGRFGGEALQAKIDAILAGLVKIQTLMDSVGTIGGAAAKSFGAEAFGQGIRPTAGGLYLGHGAMLGAWAAGMQAEANGYLGVFNGWAGGVEKVDYGEAATGDVSANLGTATYSLSNAVVGSGTTDVRVVGFDLTLVSAGGWVSNVSSEWDITTLPNSFSIGYGFLEAQILYGGG